MTIESIASRIQPYQSIIRAFLFLILIGLGVDRYFGTLSGGNVTFELVTLVAALIGLVAALGFEIIVDAFSPTDGFLRPKAKLAFYFPWLRSFVLLVVLLLWALPAIVLINGFSQ